MNGKIIYDNSISTIDFMSLRESVGFSKVSTKQAQAAIENSNFIISANIDNRTVGMVRLITDGLQALIMDLIVHPDYQKKGIGMCLMKHVLKYIQNMANDGNRILVNLLTDKGKIDFYQKFGFNESIGMRQYIETK